MLVKSIQVKSKIYSSLVAYQSIQGECINIQSGVQIDKYSSVGSNTYVGRLSSITSSKIGRYVSIANNVSIGLGEHDLDRISTSSVFYINPLETLTKGKCVIGDDVWIGVDAIVLRGANIGTGAVVAANAVVTKDVPPYAIVAGCPARILRYRFSEDNINKILASKWWEKDPKEAAIIHNQLLESFIK